MKQLKRIPAAVLPLVCFLCFAHPNAARAAAVLTDNAAFTAQLTPGYYVETFTGLLQGVQLPSTLAFTGGASNAFSYNAVATDNGGLYAQMGAGIVELATFSNGGALEFDFLGTNVTAVGGNFFSTDITGAPNGESITLLLSDGTRRTISSTSATSFMGFLSPGLHIVKLDVSPGEFDSYATVSNFEVGAAVPEPATFGLLGTGLIAVVLLGKRLSR